MVLVLPFFSSAHLLVQWPPPCCVHARWRCSPRVCLSPFLCSYHPPLHNSRVLYPLSHHHGILAILMILSDCSLSQFTHLPVVSLPNMNLNVNLNYNLNLNLKLKLKLNVHPTTGARRKWADKTKDQYQ